MGSNKVQPRVPWVNARRTLQRQLRKANLEKEKSGRIQKRLVKAANATAIRKHDKFEANVGINKRKPSGSWKEWSPRGFLASAFIFQQMSKKLFTTLFGASISTARSAVVVAADMLVNLTKSAMDGKFRGASSAAQQPGCPVQVFVEKRAWDETRHTMKVPLSSTHAVFRRLIELEKATPRASKPRPAGTTRTVFKFLNDCFFD